MASKSSKVVGGAGSGAAAGAALGSVVPGIGTAFGAGAGAVIGGALGWMLGDEEEEDEERRAEVIRQAADILGIGYNEVEQTLTEFYKQYDLAKAYGYTDANGNVDLSQLGAVGQKIKNWNQTLNKRMVDAGLAEYTADGDIKIKDQQYNFDHDTNNDGKTDVTDFLDPYAGNVIAASNRAVQHSAAGAGLGRSTGAAQAISENTAREYDKLYNTALNQYNTERQQGYQEWSDALSRSQDMFKTLLQSDQWGLSAEQGLVDSILAQQGEKTGALADLKTQKTNQDVAIKLAEL